MAVPGDWERRLLLSAVYAVVAVFISTVIVVVLASLEGPVSAQRRAVSGIEIAQYVLGFPLATGWGFAVLAFGGWRAVHGGEIALVPLFSIFIDSVLIFLVWEFIHRKLAQELTSDGLLHIDR
jgi:hypothetical protein